MTATLRPGDRVRATVEATVVDVNERGEPKLDAGVGTYWSALAGENWSFEVLSRTPEVGDVISRDDIDTYTWQDGAVLRTSRPNAPVHRAGGEWWFGARGVYVGDFPRDAVFEVLAVGP